MESASDPDQEYIYFMGSETLPSTCYILSDEASIPFYSTSNGCKYIHQVSVSVLIEVLPFNCKPSNHN